VPGIDYSDDPLLQGRNFSYFDTQLSRLGIDWQDLPINRPVCPVMNDNRDGQGQHRIPRGKVNYWPNRFDANPPAPAAWKGDAGFMSYPVKQDGMKVRMLSEKFKEHFSQAQFFYNSMTAIEKQHMTNAFSFELDHCQDPAVYKRLVQRLTEIDLSLAQAVAEKCGADTPMKQTRVNHGNKTKNLSQFDFQPERLTIESGCIAILISDGYDHDSFEAVVSAIQKEGALPFPIADKRQLVKARQSGKTAQPTNHFNGMRSTLFDAIFIPDGDHVEKLISNGIARHYVREAFSHNKAIGSFGKGNLLVEKAILAEVDAVQVAGNSSGMVDSYGVVSVGNGQGLEKFIETFFGHIANHRFWQRELDGLSYMAAA
jgi:catalase